MSMGKHKNKLIALLLFLSILSQQLVCMADVKDIFEGAVEATPETSKYVAKTYYDFMNSVAESCGYTMEEILDPDIDDSLDYKDYGKASFVRFVNWYTNIYADDYNGDEDAIEFLKNELDQCTLFGFKMSQKLWDAFKQFFSDVEKDEPIYENYTSHTLNDLIDYVHNVTNIDKSRLSAVFGMYNITHDRIVIIQSGDIYPDYYIYTPYHTDGGTWRWVDANDGWDRSKLCFTENFSENFNGLVFYTNPDSINHNAYGFYRSDHGCAWKPNNSNSVRIISMDWKYVKSTTKTEYSPYINYTSTGSAPAQVPDIIPWSTFPDHEVTDDDTKIYIPVESPEEETPTETPEQPTETPEEPTETPEDSNDGDDIFDFDPIFPDIDIDPDIELPDDWINPPDIDLDPDVDVDTPSPGGKIPHLQKLKEKFPFCIPFDLVLLFKMLNKKPKAPKWEFKHDFQIGDSKPYTWEVVVDMADYDKYVQIFREGFFLLFLVGLFFVTKKLISWQTG